MSKDDYDIYPHYGYFLGGDPRAFRPDPDGLTVDEFNRWLADCEAWDAQDIGKPQRGGPHLPLVRDGKEVGHITVSHYGLGSTDGEEPNKDWREVATVVKSEAIEYAREYARKYGGEYMDEWLRPTPSTQTREGAGERPETKHSVESKEPA